MLPTRSANLTLLVVIILMILIWILNVKVFLSSVYYFYILMTPVNWDIAPRHWGYSFRRPGQSQCFYIQLPDTLNMCSFLTDRNQNLYSYTITKYVCVCTQSV